MKTNTPDSFFLHKRSIMSNESKSQFNESQYLLSFVYIIETAIEQLSNSYFPYASLYKYMLADLPTTEAQRNLYIRIQGEVGTEHTEGLRLVNIFFSIRDGTKFSFYVRNVSIVLFDFLHSNVPGCRKCEWASSDDFPTPTLLSEFDVYPGNVNIFYCFILKNFSKYKSSMCIFSVTRLEILTLT